jgi:hypothetical protein
MQGIQELPRTHDPDTPHCTQRQKVLITRHYVVGASVEGAGQYRGSI